MTRCSLEGCKKRLGLVDKELRCRCGGGFCAGHRPAAAHSCSFDFRREWVAAASLEPVVAPKLNKI